MVLMFVYWMMPPYGAVSPVGCLGVRKNLRHKIGNTFAILALRSMTSVDIAVHENQRLEPLLPAQNPRASLRWPADMRPKVELEPTIL
jgi:hypothetical protein